MLNRIALRLATALAALSIVVGSGLAPAQAQTKTITILDSFDIKDWDPAIIYSSEVRIMLNVYETLVKYDSATGTVVPHLATEWGVSDDGLTWEFKLRQGVTFHDGTAFNAAAAKASLDRIIEIGMGGAYNWGTVE